VLAIKFKNENEILTVRFYGRRPIDRQTQTDTHRQIGRRARAHAQADLEAATLARALGAHVGELVSVVLHPLFVVPDPVTAREAPANQASVCAACLAL
jgi:uncharacterized protein YggE